MMVFLDKDNDVKKVENFRQIQRPLEYLPGWKQLNNQSWQPVANVNRLHPVEGYHSKQPGKAVGLKISYTLATSEGELILRLLQARINDSVNIRDVSLPLLCKTMVYP
jgi:hypothetical protein